MKGGAQTLLDAFTRLITDHGGSVETGADVTSIRQDAKATQAALSSPTALSARRGVICSMAPEQLYGRLLSGVSLPADITEGLSRYRYGKGNMQVHYALAHPPRWHAEGLGRVALLHLTPGLDGVSKATNEAERGILPSEPTICVGQPTALDPSRAPPGQAVLWLQLPEAPRLIKGDAAGQIAPPKDGGWTEAIREAYADRVEQLGDGLRRATDPVLRR